MHVVGYDIQPEDIIELVRIEFGMMIDYQSSKRRTNHICWPRHVLRYLLRQTHETLTYGEIGRLTGGCDHSTVMYSSNLVKTSIHKGYRKAESAKKLLSAIKDGSWAESVLKGESLRRAIHVGIQIQTQAEVRLEITPAKGNRFQAGLAVFTDNLLR